MKLFLLTLLLTGCASSDRTAGARVAAMLGEPRFVACVRGGKPDTIATFCHNGHWWLYHPAFGSIQTRAKASEPAPLWCRSATERLPDAKNIRFAPVTEYRPADIANGCLPNAMLLQRRFGGTIVERGQHAQWVKN